MTAEPWTVLYGDESGGKTVVVAEFNDANKLTAGILLSEDNYELYDLTAAEVDLLGMSEIRMRQMTGGPSDYWHEDGDGPVEILGYWLESDFAFEPIMAARVLDLLQYRIEEAAP